MFSRSYFSPFRNSYYNYSAINPYNSFCSPYSRSLYPFYPYSRYPCASVCPSRCSRIEYIPIQKSCIDYVPQQTIQYVPCERRYTDYMTVEHNLEYIPVPRIQKYVEYVPQEHYHTAYDYVPQHHSTILPKRQSMYESQLNQPFQTSNYNQYERDYEPRRRNSMNYNIETNSQYNNERNRNSYAKRNDSRQGFDQDIHMKQTAAPEMQTLSFK